ncbi:MAG: hypothetical protein RIQ56_308, partial [Candidatus Parcubacteria bacterium]
AHRRTLLWCLILLFGTGLRIFYVLATPYDVRGHDANGHVEYIRYVLAHWSLPPPHGGLEFYHPPLYYVLSALVVRGGEILGFQDSLFLMQLIALFFSVATLVVALWVLEQSLSETQRHSHFAMLGLALAAFPSLVFFASRVNNDVLSGFLSFLTLGLLLWWWKKPDWWRFLPLTISVALGILTKSSALLWIPIVLLCVMLKGKFSMRAKLLASGFFILFLILTTTGYTLPRMSREKDTRELLVGNVSILTNFVSNEPRYYVTFNPYQILRHPFNDPFNDAERRSYVWEYFFRSAFFGEFNFGDALRPIAQAILLFALFLIPLAISGIVIDVLSREALRWPLWICLAANLAGFFLYRIVYPYSSSQDFRYTIVLLIPALVALVPASRTPRWMRYAANILLALLLAGMTLFLLTVSSIIDL